MVFPMVLLTALPAAVPFVIPDFQPVAFPAPFWLLQVLLVVGFFLHAIPMNVVLGGSLIAGILIAWGKLKNHPYAVRAGKALAYSLPIFLSFAITQGIVPLLFLQLMYGPLYYTASVAMAWPWLLVLLTLLVAYYTVYIFKHKNEKLGPNGYWLLIIGFVLFVAIGFVFTNNMTLMLTPERWGPLLAKHKGWNLNLGEPTLIPRYLHFLVASFAVTGLTLGCFGLYLRRKDAAYSKWLISTGAGIFFLVTLLQVGVGAWFLLTLPKTIMLAYMGKNMVASISFMGSMLLSLLALGMGFIAWKRGSYRAFKVSLVSSLLLILGMIVMRHMLRALMTSAFFRPDLVPVNTQWDLLIAFLITAGLLIAYLIWLGRLTWKAFDTPVSTS